ncbi:hypothetical protein Tco_1343871 [Tanacetum coccineum]
MALTAYADADIAGVRYSQSTSGHCSVPGDKFSPAEVHQISKPATSMLATEAEYIAILVVVPNPMECGPHYQINGILPTIAIPSTVTQDMVHRSLPQQRSAL